MARTYHGSPSIVTLAQGIVANPTLRLWAASCTKPRVRLVGTRLPAKPVPATHAKPCVARLLFGEFNLQRIQKIDVVSPTFTREVVTLGEVIAATEEVVTLVKA